MYQIIKNLPLKKKLQLTFGSLILLFVIISAIGAFGIGDVFVQSRSLYQQLGQGQSAMYSILAQFNKNQLLTSTLLLNKSEEGEALLLQALGENKNAITESLVEDEQKGYFGELDTQSLQQLNQLFSEYFSAQEQVLSLEKSGKSQEAFMLFTETLL